MHRIASLAKRWLMGTHQGAVDSAHLPRYLDEFVFRFNRRHSRSRGMLFYRVLGACCRAWAGSLPRPCHEPEPEGCSSQVAETTGTSTQFGATFAAPPVEAIP